MDTSQDDFTEHFNAASVKSPHVQPMEPTVREVATVDDKPNTEVSHNSVVIKESTESSTIPNAKDKSSNGHRKVSRSKESTKSVTASADENGTKPVYISKSPTIKDFPDEEKPRERLRNEGADKLSAAELVAILLRAGNKGSNVKRLAEDLLIEHGGLEMLSRASWDELCSTKGIKDAKASLLLAAFEIGRRSMAHPAERRLSEQKEVKVQSEKVSYLGEEDEDIGSDFSRPLAIADMMQPLLSDKPMEEMWVILMDTRYQYRGKVKIYEGGIDQIMAKTGEILGVVVGRRCSRFVIVHNHPSGESDPSSIDMIFTNKLIDASKLLDVELADHIVVARNNWTSMRLSHLAVFDV